jgi:putative ABC transport system substrate-binding protein
MRRRELILGIGSAVVLPIAARAQQKAMPVVGWLSPMSAAAQGANRLGETGKFPAGSAVGAFHEGLNETGYVEGQNVAIEYHWADSHFDRVPALAAELVARKVDVIVTVAGNVPALAAKTATSTIPIVFTSVMNPVEEEAARTKGVKLQILKVDDESEIDAAFASLVELHVGALVVTGHSFFTERRDQLVALAARYAVPAIYHLRVFVDAGGLISYGTPGQEWYRGAGTYVGRILAGARPSDLPVQQPTRFELVINLKTAKALGLTIPPPILARADEVIE